jgi:hypothetical protein
MTRLAFALLVVTALIGCRAEPPRPKGYSHSHFEQVARGRSEDQVMRWLGEPNAVKRNGEGTFMTYWERTHDEQGQTEPFVLVFIDNKTGQVGNVSYGAAGTPE